MSIPIKIKRGTLSEFNASTNPVKAGELIEVINEGIRVFVEDGPTNSARYYEYPSAIKVKEARYMMPHLADEMLGFVFLQNPITGPYTIGLSSSTNVVAVKWWDGTIETIDVTGGGSLEKAVPASGAWAAPSPKAVEVWPCVSLADTTISGQITEVQAQTELIALDISRLTGLRSLHLADTEHNFISISNNKPTLELLRLGSPVEYPDDFSSMPALQTLRLNTVRTTGIDLSSSTNIILVELTDMSDLKYITGLSAKTSLSILNLTNCAVSGALDLSGSIVREILASNQNIESLDISGVDHTSIFGINFDVSNNQLTSITAIDTILRQGGNYYHPEALNFSNNQLDTDAIYTFLNEMATAAEPVTIDITGNPCISGAALLDGDTHTAADTIAKATEKNITLILA